MKATTLERMPPHALKRIAELERQLRLELKRSDNTCVTMEQVLTSLRVENKELREGIRESYEVYAGMDGFKPLTCSEGYCLRIIDEMAAPLAKLLDAGSDDGKG
jgi:hypothetical protein